MLAVRHLWPKEYDQLEGVGILYSAETFGDSHEEYPGAKADRLLVQDCS